MNTDQLNDYLRAIAPEGIALQGGIIGHPPAPCGNVQVTAGRPCDHPLCPLEAHFTHATLHVPDLAADDWLAPLAKAALDALEPYTRTIHKAHTCRWN